MRIVIGEMHQMGVKNYKALQMAASASTHLVLAFMLVMGFVFIIARNYLPLMFTLDQAVIDIAAGLLIVAAIFQVFDGDSTCTHVNKEFHKENPLTCNHL